MQRRLETLLQQRARHLGLNLADIAERAGMTRAYLHRLSAGKTLNPGILTLERLAKALSLPTSALYRIYAGERVSTARPPQTHEGISINEESPSQRDALLFTADVTIPDHAVVLPNERFTKTWAIQNVGNRVWANRQLVRVDREIVLATKSDHGNLVPLMHSYLASLGSSTSVPTTLPGQIAEISVDFIAPAETCSIGSVWRMADMDGTPCFGPKCFLQVIVTVMGD